MTDDEKHGKVELREVVEERVELELRIEDRPPRRVIVPMRAAITPDWSASSP